jgi:hypothetical protein
VHLASWQRQRFARALTLAFTVAIFVSGGAITAEMVSAQRATAVSIGDTGAAVGGPHAAAALDTALHAALATHPGVRVEGRVDHARYVVTGSIVEWSNRAIGADHEIRCGVSIIVTDAHGSVRAMLSGRAGARGEGNPDQLAERALLAATRSALRPLGAELR